MTLRYVPVSDVHVPVVQAIGEVDKLRDMDYNPSNWGRVEYKSCFSLNDRVEQTRSQGPSPPDGLLSPLPGSGSGVPFTLLEEKENS